jgi:hypothetical protein
MSVQQTSRLQQTTLVNLYRTPKQRYYRGWMPRLLALFILLGIVGAVLQYTPLLSKIEGHRAKTVKASTPPPLKNVIPTATTVKPTGGATIAPVTSGPTTLTTTISVSCPGAVSLSVIGQSNALNTLTVSNPAKAVSHSTGTQPEVTTYSAAPGTWTLTDISEGSAANIDWSANGTHCIQG